VARAARTPLGSRRRLPPDERRAQLLAVALEVFAREGLGAARHAAIARVAGVAVSTVFLYFPTREALVDAVLSEVERFYLDQSERAFAGEAPAPAKLRALADAFLGSLETDLPHALVWLDWSTHFREHVWQRFLGLMDGVVGRCERVIREGQAAGTIPAGRDPRGVARLFVGSATMFVHMKLTGAQPEEIERISRTVIAAAAG
jgi:TetR/AcrR family hemagglutinin/protease transcriptional regulator